MTHAPAHITTPPDTDRRLVSLLAKSESTYNSKSTPLPMPRWNVVAKCVQRQQGCLQCCRVSCSLGVESAAEVVHKSAVATWCASEPREKIEGCRLLLTDSQSQFILGEQKGVSRGGRGGYPCIYKTNSRKKSYRDLERARSILEVSRRFWKRCSRNLKCSPAILSLLDMSNM